MYMLLITVIINCFLMLAKARKIKVIVTNYKFNSDENMDWALGVDTK